MVSGRVGSFSDFTLVFCVYVSLIPDFLANAGFPILDAATLVEGSQTVAQ